MIGTVRLAGPYEAPEPYGLALVLCMAAALLWLQMRRRGRTTRVAGVMIVALELVMVFFTFFRVAWFSAIVVLVASLALRPNRTGRALGRIAVVALVVGLVFVELDQVAEYLKLGVKAIGLTTALFPPDKVKAGDKAGIAALARQAVAAMAGVA